MKLRKTDIEIYYDDVADEYDSTSIYASYKDLKYLVSLIKGIEDEKEIILIPEKDLDDVSCSLRIRNETSLDEVNKEEVDINVVVEEPNEQNNTLTIYGGKEGLKLLCDVFELAYPFMKGYKRSDLKIVITFSHGVVSCVEPITSKKYASLSYIYEDHSEDYMWFNH